MLINVVTTTPEGERVSDHRSEGCSAAWSQIHQNGPTHTHSTLGHQKLCKCCKAPRRCALCWAGLAACGALLNRSPDSPPPHLPPPSIPNTHFLPPLQSLPVRRKSRIIHSSQETLPYSQPCQLKVKSRNPLKIQEHSAYLAPRSSAVLPALVLLRQGRSTSAICYYPLRRLYIILRLDIFRFVFVNTDNESEPFIFCALRWIFIFCLDFPRFRVSGCRESLRWAIYTLWAGVAVC